LLITNIFILQFKNFILIPGTGITPLDLLEDTLKNLVRGIVTFQTSFESGEQAGDDFSFQSNGTSIFILLLFVVLGSGLIADDLSNHTTEIYYSKIEKYEYILAKILAFMIGGTLLITLPYVIEFVLLFIGIGNIDFFAALPLLFFVIIFTQIIIFTYCIIFLAFSSLTKRRLYAGLTAFMLFFIISMIAPYLAMQEGEIGFAILFDVLSLLSIISYLIDGITFIPLNTSEGSSFINLNDGSGVETFMVYGMLGFILLLGFLIIIYQVYRRHSS
jgi:ABC-type transport system involved in multi-copper enzyme maturation permease subunit